MAAIDLNTLSTSQVYDLFSSVDNILCDNDGVLSVFGVFLPGVLECLNKFRESGKFVKIVTNNTAFGRHRLAAAFAKQGLQCTKEDFITPTCAMINYLKNIHFNKKAWLMSFEPMMEEFKEHGFSVADSEDPKIVPIADAQKYFLNMDPEIKAIIMDISLNTSFGCVSKTIEYLKNNPDIQLLFGCTDEQIPVAKDKLILGPKYFQDIVVKLSGREPKVFGKPSDNFGKYLIETLKCDPSRTLFIGDGLEADIGFAKKMGFKQLLVLSGTSTLNDLQTCKNEFRPDYYINSMDDLSSIYVNKLE